MYFKSSTAVNTDESWSSYYNEQRLPAAVFGMPFQRHDNHDRGVLIVSRKSTPTWITLQGDGLANANALVLDGSFDGNTVDAEPGFVPPVERTIAANGQLRLGPFAIALVRLDEL